MFSKSAFAAAGLALGVLAAAAPARAQTTVKTGTLTCHVSSGWGFIFGSSRDLRCTYAGGGKVANYTGKISKFGVDIGYVQSGVIVWAVLAPTSDVAPGMLAGDYGGVTAGASAAVGASANVLVGGSKNTISLQPLSVGGEQGINVAAGIAAITLRYQR